MEEEIESELSKAYHVQQLVNNNLNKSAQELYEMALESAYNINESECSIC